MSRSAWLGAGSALALAVALTVIGGGAPRKPESLPAPASNQAPAPTLVPVVKDSTLQPDASTEAPHHATPIHKESAK